MKVSDKIMKTAQRMALWVSAGLMASFAAWGQGTPTQANGIEGIAVAGQQGGNIIVKITLRQPLVNPPAGFTINNPPRIAFDFPDTEGHFAEHSDLIREATEFLRKFEAGTLSAMLLLNSLKAWLINHIKNSDRKYAGFLRRQRWSG